MTAALEISAAEPGTILISNLKRDPELICRAAGVNKATAREYADAMKAGTVFPPVVVFTDSKGVHWLADGFHRTEAANLAGLVEIPADRRLGSRKDALLHAASANSSHGLRRSTADKRRSIELLIGTFPKMSDRKIGEACGVDNKTVAATRARLAKPAEEIPHPETEQAAAPPEPIDPDTAIVSKLLKQAERLIAQCPESKRVELWAHITNIFESKTEPEIVPPKKSNGGASIIRAPGAALDQS